MDKVFLRENDSVSSMPSELRPYQEDGFLDHALLQGPKHPLQTVWYNDCGVMARKQGYSWVAFLDLDEFMVVLNGCAPAAPAACTRVARARQVSSPCTRLVFSACATVFLFEFSNGSRPSNSAPDHRCRSATISQDSGPSVSTVHNSLQARQFSSAGCWERPCAEQALTLRHSPC